MFRVPALIGFCILTTMVGCYSTPWVDESVFREAPAIVVVDPRKPGIGMATVRGPRHLLVTGHHVPSSSGAGTLRIGGASYPYRVTDGVYDPEAGGWLLLELQRPLAGSFRSLSRDYVSPIPVGDPIFILCAKQPTDVRPGQPIRLNLDDISVTRTRVIRSPVHEGAESLAEFLIVDTDLGEGCSGSPAYWWPPERSEPVEIGFMSGSAIYTDDHGRQTLQLGLIRRPHELAPD